MYNPQYQNQQYQIQTYQNPTYQNPTYQNLQCMNYMTPMTQGIVAINDPFVDCNAPIWKKEEAKLQVQKTEQMAKVKADIASQRELQRTFVTQAADGALYLNKEAFNDYLKKGIGYSYKQNTLYHCIGENKPVVYLELVAGNRAVHELYIDPSCESKTLLKRFREAGIVLGFTKKKALEVIEGILACGMNGAEYVAVPYEQGWYISESGELSYAYPEVLTWRKVMNYVERNA